MVAHKPVSSRRTVGLTVRGLRVVFAPLRLGSSYIVRGRALTEAKGLATIPGTFSSQPSILGLRKSQGSPLGHIIRQRHVRADPAALRRRQRQL